MILKLLRAIQSRLRDHADLVSMTGMQLTHRFNLRRNKHRLVFKQEELANALNFFSTNIDAVKVTLFECVICGDFEKLSDIVTHLISSTHLKKNVVDYDYRQSYLHDRVNELIYTMIDDREGMDEAPSVRGKWTLLHTAAYYNRVEMLSFFREHGGEACDALLATPVGRRKANALHLVAWREERHAQEALIWMLSFMGDKHLQGAMLQEDTEWCRPFDAAVIGGNRRNADLLRFNIDEVYGRKKLDESIMRVQQEKLFEQAQHDRQLQSLDTVGSKLVGKGIFWPTLVENVNGYGHEPREVLRYGMIRGWGLPFGESSAGLKEFSEEKYENIAVWHLEIEEEKCTTRSIFTSDRTKVANASTEIAVLLKAKIEAES
uniref:Uncharacterized protein n=1 Tax=Octactis speculum TaxID=3111310 RepID=A0A7S2BCL6_9STRA